MDILENITKAAKEINNYLCSDSQMKTVKENFPLPKFKSGAELNVMPYFERIENPITRVSVLLNPHEVAVYDYCIVSNMIAESIYNQAQKETNEINKQILNAQAQAVYDEVRTCLSWFRQYSAENYMTLLD